MVTFHFDQFFEVLKAGAVDIAKAEGKEFVKEATKDGKQFLDDLKDDLVRWTKLVEEKKLTKDEFKFLVNGQKDLAKMHALTQAGMAAVRIDRMRVALVDLVIKAAQTIV